MDRGGWIGIIISVIILSPFLIGMSLITYDIVTEETETTIIEDKIINVDITNDDYMTIYTENGEQYNIKYEVDITQYDFTVNSVLKIKLEKTTSLLNKNKDNVWEIKNMIKVEE